MQKNDLSPGSLKKKKKQIFSKSLLAHISDMLKEIFLYIWNFARMEGTSTVNYALFEWDLTELHIFLSMYSWCCSHPIFLGVLVNRSYFLLSSERRGIYIYMLILVCNRYLSWRAGSQFMVAIIRYKGKPQKYVGKIKGFASRKFCHYVYV